MTKHFSSPTDLIFLLFFSFLFLFNIFLIYLLFRKIFTGRIVGKKSHPGAETETSNYFLWPYQYYLKVSETASWHKLQCFYFSNMMQHWVGGKGLFEQSWPLRISGNFSRNWLGLNNIYEILSWDSRNLGNLYIFESPTVKLKLENMEIGFTVFLKCVWRDNF